MRHNPNKTITAASKKLVISYVDNNKQHSVFYDEKSILKKVQVTGHSSRYPVLPGVKNETQQLLYRKALYGLSIYDKTPEVLDKMSFREKKDIITLQQKTQAFLNKWKHDLVHLKLKSFLDKLFYRSTFAKDLANYQDYYDESERNMMDFTALRISKDMIIEKLIEEEIFPSNFYELA